MSGLNTVIPEAVGRSPSPKKSALPEEMRWMLPVCDESTAWPRNKVLYSSTRPRNLIFSSIWPPSAGRVIWGKRMIALRSVTAWMTKEPPSADSTV